MLDHGEIMELTNEVSNRFITILSLLNPLRTGPYYCRDLCIMPTQMLPLSLDHPNGAMRRTGVNW